MREPKDYLFDIIVCIDKIVKTTDLPLEQFYISEEHVDSTCMKLQRIGESLNSIKNFYQTIYTDIEWKKAIGMRHIISHEYYSIDPTIVFNTARNDLPKLRTQIMKIIEDNGWADEFQNPKH